LLSRTSLSQRAFEAYNVRSLSSMTYLRDVDHAQTKHMSTFRQPAQSL
jgi:hypothetical protein